MDPRHPSKNPKRCTTSQHVLNLPVIRDQDRTVCSRRFFQQTTTVITTVEELPLEPFVADEIQESMSTNHTEKPSTSSSSFPVKRRSPLLPTPPFPPCGSISLNQTGRRRTFPNISSRFKVSNQITKRKLQMPGNSGKSISSTNKIMKEQQQRHELEPRKVPFVDLTLPKLSLPTHDTKLPHRNPAIPAEAFKSLDSNDSTKKRIDSPSPNIPPRQEKTTLCQKITRPLSAPHPKKTSPNPRLNKPPLIKTQPHGNSSMAQQGPHTGFRPGQKKTISSQTNARTSPCPQIALPSTNPSSTSPHQKKETPVKQTTQTKSDTTMQQTPPLQRPVSDSTTSKEKMSSSERVSFSISTSNQVSTTPRPPIINKDNCKKRKAPTPFFPPGEFISLNMREPPKKKTKKEMPDIDIDPQAKRYFHYRLPPHTLTESRRLFMKDERSGSIYDFFLQSQQTEEFLRKKQHLTEALEKVVREKMIPTSRMFLVGSSLNGFGSLTSDIDICLVLDTEKEKLTSRKKVLHMLRELQKLLQRAAFAKNLQVIPAKVPILKFRDALSGLHCDINVNNLTGIRNSELLRCYANFDHRVRPLVIVVKEWAQQNKINDASQGTLSSYSLVLMVIHFLQCGVKPRLLPALQQQYPKIFTTQTPVTRLRENQERIRPFRSKNEMSLFDLLLQFFEYFGKRFDFDMQVMCVRLGMTRHVRNFQGIANEWSKVIKIEEPFEHTNTARAVSCAVTARRILQKFKNAYEVLHTQRRLDCLIKLRKNRGSVIVLDD